MAFSTQKEYFNLPYLNELSPPTCASLDRTKLQTYTSSTDQRSWSMKKENQAQYLLDLVACRTYSTESKPQLASCNENRDISSPLVGGDSLLNAATNELTRLENLLLEKNDLKSQLNASQEKLQILNEEHQTVNAILNDRRNTEVVRMLEKKIEQFKCENKIDKNDENELTKITDALVKREQSARVLEAQNCYLRRLVAKLSTRCRLETIHPTPEQSTDIRYLQSQVDKLRKEVCLLRDMEDKQLKTETTSRGIQESCDDNDVENIHQILTERNALREKCRNFAAMEGKICQWKREAEEFEAFRIQACNALKKKNEEIKALQYHIDEIEQEEDTLCSTVDCIKDENRKLREEICKCNDMLQCLSNEICEKNCVIEQYDKQFQQVLGVIENVQKKSTLDIIDLQDGHTQTPNEMEKLATTTRLTLDHIQKELENRNVVECQMAKSHEELLEAKENLVKSKEELDKSKEELVKSKENLIKVEENLAKTEENLDLANCEMKLLKKEKELQEALLNQKDADCQKSIDELKDKLSQAEQENKRKLEQMEQENKRKLENMQSEIEKERQSFANERGDFEKAKQDFERQKQSWAEEKKTLMAESGEGDRLRQEFEKERQAWINERKNFIKEKDDWEKERQACAKINADLSKEKAEMERIKQDFDKARQTFDKERQDMQREREGFASERKQFEERVANFEKIKQGLEKEKQSLEEKANQLADTLSKKEERRLGSDAEMSNLRNQNDDLKKSLTECQNKNDELNKALKEEHNKYDELNKVLKDSRNKNDELNKQLKDCHNKYDEQNKVLKDTQNKNDELNKQLKDCHNKYDEQNKVLKDTQNKNDELNKQLKDCQNEMQAQKEKVSKLVSEIDKLKAELNSSQQQLKEVGGLVKDISNVKDRNEQLSTVVKAADIDCQRLLTEEKRKNADLKKQLENANTTPSEPKRPEKGTSDVDCQKLLAEERRKIAELKKQLENANEAQRERKNLEKEIEGHRTSNNALRNSISKLTSKINTKSAADFEKELRVLLDNFTDEICKWRCEKNCKLLTRTQEIAKKIYEYGLEYLTLKELVYLHQQMCEVAKKFTPVTCGGEKKGKERRCCKCTGQICPAPTVPNENDSVLLDKLAILERDIQLARENLRKLKKQQEPIELDDDQELETMRPNTFKVIRRQKNVSDISRTRLQCPTKEEYDHIPTKDRYGV